MLLIGYNRCSTCKKAKVWLTENGFEFEERPIMSENPTEEELRIWIEKSGQSADKFFNKTGHYFSELNLKAELPDMPEQEKIHILSLDGRLVRRPLLIDGDTVLVGFKVKEWEKALL